MVKLVSYNRGGVALGFISTLKVNTTVVVVGTLVAPLAGALEMMVDWACISQVNINTPTQNSLTPRQLLALMAHDSIPAGGFCHVQILQGQIQPIPSSV
jgi:hypothetical protein